MATRFYLPSEGTITVIPTTWGSGWTWVNGTSDTFPTTNGKSNTPFVTLSVSNDGTAGATFGARMRYVSPPLKAQTLAGTVKGQMRCAENNAGNNATLAIAIRRINSAGVIQDTLLETTAADTTTTPPEFATSLTNRRFQNSAESAAITLTSRTFNDGDRLVIEFGVREARNTGTETLRVGDNAASDLAENDTATTDANTWIEFSQTINFSNSSYITGRARINQRRTTSITGTANIVIPIVTSSVEITGKARIQNSIDLNIQGTTRISKTENAFISGQARVQASNSIEIGGKASIASASALDDTGLLARYFLDEASSGQVPTSALDGSGIGSAFDLPITYDANLSYVETAGNRGLEWAAVLGDGRANAAIAAGNKVYDGIHGKTKATVECVVSVDDLHANGSRIFIINADTSNGVIGFRGSSATSWQFVLNNVVMRTWDGVEGSRDVYHAVVDTTLATADDRVKIYRNGTLLSPTISSNPAQNATISVDASSELFIGNRGTTGSYARSLDGRVYYCAIYGDSAFTSTQVTNNYDILTLDDDTPVAAPTSTTSIQGKARIQAVTTTSITGTARIQKAEIVNQQGIARLTTTAFVAQTGKARIQNTAIINQQGIVRVQSSASISITGQTRVQNTSSFAQTGKAQIRNTVEAVQTGRARITNSASIAQLGKARIQNSGALNQQGVAKIQVAGSGVTLSDDFERASANTLGANWSDEAGGFAIIDNSDAQGELQNFSKNLAIHVTDTNTVEQYVRIQAHITSIAFPGVAFRYDNSSSGHFLCDWSTTQFWWAYYSSTADSGTNIIDSQSITFVSGNAVGITIKGTGASTRLRVWFNTTALAPDIGGETWDGNAPDINHLITGTNFADVGKGVGMCMFRNDPSGTASIERFDAGDIPTESGNTTNTTLITGRARITNTASFSQTGKSRLSRTEAIDTQGIARITQITGVFQSGRARITNAAFVAQTGQARIQKAGELNQQGSARITNTVSISILGRSRITQLVSLTQAGKARVQNSGLINQFGIARIRQSADLNQTGKTRIQTTANISISGKAAIHNTSSLFQSGKANINAAGFSTTQMFISGRARVINTSFIAQTGRARIRNSANVNISGLAQIAQAGSINIQGKARLQNSAAITQQGKARIQNSSSLFISGVAKIACSYIECSCGSFECPSEEGSLTISGKARITATNSTTQTGKGRISRTEVVNQTGRARIQQTGSVFQTGKARVQASDTAIQTGVARIHTTANLFISGKASIAAAGFNTGGAFISGKARTQAQSLVTQTGKASIRNTSSVFIGGKAYLNAAGYNTNRVFISGKASVFKAENAVNQTGIVRIEKAGFITISGKARVQIQRALNQSGIAQIRATSSISETGTARITKTASFTQQGKGRIVSGTSVFLSGKARVTARETLAITGAARITNTAIVTQQGVAAIIYRNSTVISGKARLTNISFTRITGKANIYNPQERIYAVVLFDGRGRQNTSTGTTSARTFVVETSTKTSVIL